MSNERYISKGQLSAIHDFLIVFPVDPEKTSRVQHVELQAHLQILLRGQRSVESPTEKACTSSSYEEFHRKRWELFNAIFPLIFKDNLDDSDLQIIQQIASEMSELNKVFLFAYRIMK